MISQSEPQYVNEEQYKQDIQEHDELYYVAIKLPVKFAVGAYEQEDGSIDEYLIVTMTRPNWHAIANMVMHDMEQDD